MNEELRIEVSKRIKEEYGDGREYYAFHGKKLAVIPDRFDERPAKHFFFGTMRIFIWDNFIWN
ncbi:hypothetical protein [Thermobacillus composti]|uniref:hypothetical protein n=1 Tax=Thermobacillus composti TaxID=377615 RepID=UPI001E3D1302|nr:hypothetical protein [Thermobacillus composti]